MAHFRSGCGAATSSESNYCKRGPGINCPAPSAPLPLLCFLPLPRLAVSPRLQSKTPVPQLQDAHLWIPVQNTTDENEWKACRNRAGCTECRQKHHLISGHIFDSASCTRRVRCIGRTTDTQSCLFQDPIASWNLQRPSPARPPWATPLDTRHWRLN